MEKIRRFFNNLNEKRSYQIVFFIVSMCVVLGMYLGIRAKISVDKSHEYMVVEDKNLIKCIEDVTINKKELCISGWCFYKNVDSKSNSVQVFLRNITDESDIVWMDTESVIREDINDYYDCEYDYSHTGFAGSRRVSKLDLEEKTYEILLKVSFDDPKGEQDKLRRNKSVTTNLFIKNGKLTAALVDKGSLIETASKELDEVIQSGKLLWYEENQELYIYQYRNKLYWIAGEQFFFRDDNFTRIAFQLDTTRVDKLPTSRVKEGYDWDSRGFVFEENEMLQWNTQPYRVAKCDIPSEYPITWFWTGHYYGEESIWETTLNLDIEMLVDETY